MHPQTSISYAGFVHDDVANRCQLGQIAAVRVRDRGNDTEGPKQIFNRSTPGNAFALPPARAPP